MRPVSEAAAAAGPVDVPSVGAQARAILAAPSQSPEVKKSKVTPGVPTQTPVTERFKKIAEKTRMTSGFDLKGSKASCRQSVSALRVEVPVPGGGVIAKDVIEDVREGQEFTEGYFSDLDRDPKELRKERLSAALAKGPPAETVVSLKHASEVLEIKRALISQLLGEQQKTLIQEIAGEVERRLKHAGWKEHYDWVDRKPITKPKSTLASQQRLSAPAMVETTAAGTSSASSSKISNVWTLLDVVEQKEPVPKVLKTLTDEELQKIYVWIDSIPLTRPKRNIQRDFSDGG
jgi:hypothetical protein